MGVVELQTCQSLLSCPQVASHSGRGFCVLKQPWHHMFSVDSADLFCVFSFSS